MKDSTKATSGALGSGPLGRCVTIAAAVVAVDLGSKVVAMALLGDGMVRMTSTFFLRVVHNDGFARWQSLGALNLPATWLLAAALLYLLARSCAPLAALDSKVPRALGLVAGATVANAADIAIHSKGVVDFIGFRTATGAIIFNLADVAAYIGVALLIPTTLKVGRMAVAERRATARRRAELQPRYPRLRAAADAAWAGRPRRPVLELVRPIPVTVDDAPPPAVQRTTGGPRAYMEPRPDGR